MVNAGRGEVVVLEFAPVVEALLGDHEQGNALDAGRSSLDAGQKEIYDVVDPIVVGSRNEDFLPAHLVIAMLGRFCRCGDIGEGTAGLGLCEGHGALPLAGEHHGHVFLVELG